MNIRYIRHVFVLAAAVASAAALPAHAQTAASGPWPAKAIRMIIPVPPGGTSDILARMLGQKLTESWGQQIIVESRPGANGNIGPAKIPTEITNKISTEVRRILALAEIKDKLSVQGTTPMPTTPQEMGRWLAAEKDRWAKVVKDSGFKIE